MNGQSHGTRSPLSYPALPMKLRASRASISLSLPPHSLAPDFFFMCPSLGMENLWAAHCTPGRHCGPREGYEVRNDSHSDACISLLHHCPLLSDTGCRGQ